MPYTSHVLKKILKASRTGLSEPTDWLYGYVKKSWRKAMARKDCHVWIHLQLWLR